MLDPLPLEDDYHRSRALLRLPALRAYVLAAQRRSCMPSTPLAFACGITITSVLAAKAPTAFSATASSPSSIASSAKTPGASRTAPCMPLAPDPETGARVVNAEACIGCGMCHESVPLEVPVVDTETGVSTKCMTCWSLRLQCPTARSSSSTGKTSRRRPSTRASSARPRWLRTNRSLFLQFR